MDMILSGEYRQLGDQVRRWLAAWEAQPVRQAGTTPDVAAWQDMARTLGILEPGVSDDRVAMIVIMEELGRALYDGPFAETAVVSAGLLVRGGVFPKVLEAIAAGDMRCVLAWMEPQGGTRLAAPQSTAIRDGSGWVLNGAKTMVALAPWATHFLITARIGKAHDDTDEIGLFLVDAKADGLVRTDYPTIDGLCAAEIAFPHFRLAANDRVGGAAMTPASLLRARDEAIVARGAESLGLMRAMLRDTIEYTAQRRQFAAPLSQFQALQHRMVDMYRHLERARSAVLLAALSLDGDLEDRSRAVCTAKVVCARASRFVGQQAIQLHGGMGMTADLRVSRYFRRATVIEAEFGTADQFLAERIAA